MQHGDYFLGLKYATCLYVYVFESSIININLTGKWILIRADGGALGSISRLKIVRVTRHPLL